MNSMEDLNEFAQNAITYDDDRPQSVSINAVNKYVALSSTVQTFELPVGITVNSTSSVSYATTYDVDVGATTSATVTWDTLPTSDFSSSVPSTGVYRVTGPALSIYFPDYAQPTVTYPSSYVTNNTIDVTLTYPGTGGDTVTSYVDVIWPLAGGFSYDTSGMTNFANSFDVDFVVEGFNLTTINTANVTATVGTLSSGSSATITSNTVTQDGQDAVINIQGNISSGDWSSVTSIPVTVEYDGISESKSILLHAEYIPGMLEEPTGAKGASFKYYHFTLEHYASGIALAYQTNLDIILGTWSNLVGYTNKILVADGFKTYTEVLALTDGGVGGSLGGGAYQKIYDSGVSTSTSYPVRIDTADGNWGSIRRPPERIDHEFTVVVDWGTGNPQPMGDIQAILKNVPEVAHVTERTRGMY